MTWGGAVAAAGVIAGLSVASSTRDLRAAIAVALELFTAAGLLHLAVEASWTSLATAAAIVGVRKLVSRGLGAAAR